MKSILRSVAAVLLGSIAGGAVIAAIELAAAAAFPLPGGTRDLSQITRDNVGSVPAGLFVAVLIAWGIASALGGSVAARIAPRAPRGHAYATVALFAAGALYNLITLPHPVWMWPGAALAFAAGAASVRVPDRSARHRAVPAHG